MTYKKKVIIDGKEVEITLRTPKEIMESFAQEVVINEALDPKNKEILEHLIEDNLRLIISRQRDELAEPQDLLMRYKRRMSEFVDSCKIGIKVTLRDGAEYEIDNVRGLKSAIKRELGLEDDEK